LQGPFEALQRLLPVISPYRHLDEERIVFRRDTVSLIHGTVEPYSRTARGLVHFDPLSPFRHEVVLRIFRIDPYLNRFPMQMNPFPGDMHLPPFGDPDLLPERYRSL